MTSWAAWVPQETAVSVFVRRPGELLLIHKKRGLGTGKVTAPGGRLEAGESWRQAAVRETQEETGLTPLNLDLAADLAFQFTTGYALRVGVFWADGAEGRLTVTDEADPFWHPASQLPWNQMWADDALWLPPLLEGLTVRARFVFDGEVMREAQVRTQTSVRGDFERLTTEAFGL